MWPIVFMRHALVVCRPIALLSLMVGRKMGVAADGDRSVEATMRVIAGFVGVAVYYPATTIISSFAFDSLLAAPACLACQSQIVTSFPLFKTAQNLDLRCALHPAPLVPGVPTKTRLESRI